MATSQTLQKKPNRSTAKIYPCMRCGVCMRSCPHNLSPILIKEAFEKEKYDRVMQLRADLCEGCGNCTYVCPSRIDLRASVLRAKASIRKSS